MRCEASLSKKWVVSLNSCDQLNWFRSLLYCTNERFEVSVLFFSILFIFWFWRLLCSANPLSLFCLRDNEWILLTLENQLFTFCLCQQYDISLMWTTSVRNTRFIQSFAVENYSVLLSTFILWQLTVLSLLQKMFSFLTALCTTAVLSLASTKVIPPQFMQHFLDHLSNCSSVRLSSRKGVWLFLNYAPFFGWPQFCFILIFLSLFEAMFDAWGTL